jgi:arginase family enzyme
MGIPSFMRLPVTRELKGVDVAVMGVPFDSGTSYRTGTRFGPRKIREASLMIWGHNSTLNVSPLKKLNVVDYGDVSVVPTSIEHTMTAITNAASEIINTGATLITLGGDHSIALPSCARTQKNMDPFRSSTLTRTLTHGNLNSKK